MTENQEEETNFNIFYNSIARYFKEGEEMAELRAEDTNPDEVEQTIFGADTYHEVLDFAKVFYPIPIEKSIETLKVISNIQKEIQEIEDGRKTK